SVVVDPWICPVASVFDAELHVGSAVFLREIQHLITRPLVFLTVVGKRNRIGVLGNGAGDEVAAGYPLAVGQRVVAGGNDILVPFVAALESSVRKARGRVVAQVEAVNMDRFVGPFAGESELTPGADVLLRPARVFRVPDVAVPSATPLSPEDPVELLY